MSVQEVARGFGVPAVGPLMRMLKAEEPLSPNQAVACLGRSVHVKTAARIVDTLMEQGVLASGLSYGSACSGIDTFAAAVWRWLRAARGAMLSRARAPRFPGPGC